jgi:hypothetical protein
MCFNDGREPDIWLTVENGKYVPAAPLVYVPGLRQVQDRRRYKTNNGQFRLVSDDEVIRVPANIIGLRFPTESALENQPSAAMDGPAPAAAQTRPPEEKAEVPLQSTPDQDSSATNPTPNNSSLAASDTPETQSEQFALPTSESGSTESTRDTNSQASCEADAEVSSSEETGSQVRDEVPQSPSPSSPSSLRSILKKTSSSASEDSPSQAYSQFGEGENGTNLSKQNKCKRPKSKKSVSFTDDVTPPAPLPVVNKEPPYLSAMEAGAAIAKQMIEMENAPPPPPIAQVEGGVRPRGSAMAEGAAIAKQIPARERATRNRVVDARRLGSVDGALDVRNNPGQARQFPNMNKDSGKRRAFEGPVNSCSDDDDGCTDDEILGRWP